MTKKPKTNLPKFFFLNCTRNPNFTHAHHKNFTRQNKHTNTEYKNTTPYKHTCTPQKNKNNRQYIQLQITPDTQGQEPSSKSSNLKNYMFFYLDGLPRNKINK